MCGRYVSASSPDRIAAYFDAAVDAEPLAPSYNVAPTNDVYAVVAGPDGAPVVRVFHWGLVPGWAKDAKIGSKMINARAETVADKPAYRSAFRKHRLIIPMDGFYEWRQPEAGATAAKTAGGKPVKQPTFINRLDGEPLAVAGLWSAWRDRSAGADAPWLHSCTLITTTANQTMAPIHDRMPVILPRSAWAAWLDPSNADTESLVELLRPAADDLLATTPVSTAVNNVRNKGPELIEPAQPTVGDSTHAR